MHRLFIIRAASARCLYIRSRVAVLLYMLIFWRAQPPVQGIEDHSNVFRPFLRHASMVNFNPLVVVASCSLVTRVQAQSEPAMLGLDRRESFPQQYSTNERDGYVMESSDSFSDVLVLWSACSCRVSLSDELESSSWVCAGALVCSV